MDLLTTLVLGGYAFTSGAYFFMWSLFRRIAQLWTKVAVLDIKVENHLQHELESVKRRLDDLERGG